MAKSNENWCKKFLGTLRRVISKQSTPEGDMKKFAKHIKESASKSTRPPAEDETKEIHKDDNKSGV